MIDINTYRQRIGSFSQISGPKNSCKVKVCSHNTKKYGVSQFTILKFLLRMILLVSFLQMNHYSERSVLQKNINIIEGNVLQENQNIVIVGDYLQENHYMVETSLQQNYNNYLQLQYCIGGQVLQNKHYRGWGCATFKRGSANFYARYTYGNKQQVKRGIKICT